METAEDLGDRNALVFAIRGLTNVQAVEETVERFGEQAGS
jgi:hypothetical protein